MNDVLTAVAKADQPAATFQALAALVDAQIGARLFTVLQIDQDRAVLRRAYSNMPQAYPVGGEKPLHDTDWSRHLLDRKEPFVAQNRAELA